MFGPFKKNTENEEVEMTTENSEETMNENTENSEEETVTEQENQAEEGAPEKDEAEEKEDSCAVELAYAKDQLARLGADFQNYKRRTEKDRSHWMHMIQSDLITDLLPLVDNFDRALEEAEKEDVSEEVKKWMQGFEMIHKELSSFLKKQDVKEIEQMETFDPELHEALMQVESEDHKEGDITQVLQRGYSLKGKVIRPAKVAVCK